MIFFGWRENDEHSKLKFGDLVLKSDENNNEYVEWITERSFKTRDGSDLIQERQFNPKMFTTNTERCPVRIFKKYLEHRPSAVNTLKVLFIWR